MIKQQHYSSVAACVTAGLAAVALACATFTGPSQEPPAQPTKDLHSVVFASKNTNGPMARLLGKEMTIHLDNVLLKDVFTYLNTNAGCFLIEFDSSLPVLTETLMDVNLDKVILNPRLILSLSGKGEAGCVFLHVLVDKDL